MRNVTVADIFRRARKRADMTSSGFYTDADCFDLLNAVYTNLYDALVQAYQNYFYDTFSFVTVPGQSLYPLPDDFYKLILCQQQVSPNQFSIIFPFNELERGSLLTTAPLNVGTIDIVMKYIPAAPIFTSLTEEIDGFNGWDDLIVLDMAIAMLESEESSTDSIERRRAQLFTRLTSAAQNRDVTLPGKVTDVTSNIFALTPDLLQYRFYGNGIEFLNVSYLGV